MSEIKIEEKKAIRGGEFLVKETHPNEIFIPEEWNEEQRMIEQMCYDFMKAELFPILDKIDSMSDPELMPTLMQKAGELGLLGLSIPEEYGGAGLDQIAYGIIMQELERCDSGLRSTSSVQSSLVMYPIWKFGSEEQSKKYLPKRNESCCNQDCKVRLPENN